MITLYLLLFIIFFAIALDYCLEQWWWIDILKDADPQKINEAKKASEKSEVPILPQLTFTEENFKWVLLYEHISLGQITPNQMRRMHREDLEYIAGMELSHPALIENKNYHKLTKIHGNVSRAKNELAFRNLLWSV